MLSARAGVGVGGGGGVVEGGMGNPTDIWL